MKSSALPNGVWGERLEESEDVNDYKNDSGRSLLSLANVVIYFIYKKICKMTTLEYA